MHGHELAFSLPGWFRVVWIGVVVYMVGAFLFGCPYCMMPNMQWPVELVRALLGRDRDS